MSAMENMFHPPECAIRVVKPDGGTVVFVSGVLPLGSATATQTSKHFAVVVTVGAVIDTGLAIELAVSCATRGKTFIGVVGSTPLNAAIPMDKSETPGIVNVYVPEPVAEDFHQHQY